MERIDAQTVGVISALQTCVAALMRCHPNPDAVRQALHQESEPVTAMLLGRPTPEAALAGFDATMELLASRLG